MPTPLILPFADGSYAFDLSRIALLQELQEKTGSGPMAVFRRLVSGEWRIEDVTETLRLALIGGGTAPVQAAALVQRWVIERPLVESLKIAIASLQAVMVGSAAPEGNEPGGPAA